MFYSKLTGGFYSTEIHGSAMPKDCVEITDEKYHNLLESQGSGKILTTDTKGFPIAIDKPPFSKKDSVLGKIYQLEASVTARRIREAVISKDTAWIANVQTQIEVLRKTLE